MRTLRERSGSATASGPAATSRLVVGLACGSLGFLASTPTRAQVADTSVAGVAQAFLDAVADERWDEAATLFHPEAAAAYQAHVVLLLRRVREEEPETVDGLMAAHPSLTREEAERHVARMKRWLEERKERNRVERHFPGIGSVEEFEAIPATEVFARALERLAAAWRAGPGFDLDPRVIGHVEEGMWANVLYRFGHEFSEGHPAQRTGVYRHLPHVLMLRRYEDGWRIGSATGVLERGFYGPGLLPALDEGACPGRDG